MKEFNYCIASQWPQSDRICAYMIHSSEIFYGSEDDAESALEWAKRSSPDKQWRIVKINFGT